MNVIIASTFAVALLLIGLVASINPSAVMSFYEKHGVRAPFAERTVERSIRFAGIIALLMAAVVMWTVLYGR